MGEQARHRLSRSLSERLEGPWGVWGFFGAEGGGPSARGGGVHGVGIDGVHWGGAVDS